MADNIHQLPPDAEAARRLSERQHADLRSGGGGGTSDGMEQRVGRLEEDVKELKADMKAIRIDLAEIKGRLFSMPTTLQLIAFAIAVFVASGLLRYFAP